MPPPKGRRKFPDEAHEALAVWVEETIAAQATNGSDIGDALLLADTLFTLIDQTTATGSTERGQLQQRVTTLESQVADLLTRVAALEAVTAPLP